MKNHVSSHHAGFTLVELLTVMAIIAILVGLVLGTAGYVQKAAARKRTATEIKAFETALESYKADNGIYPAPTGSANQALYQALTGDGSDKLVTNGVASNGRFATEGKAYFTPKKDQYSPTAYTLIDPFGKAYNYRVGSGAVNSATFDLWSEAGGGSDTNKWIKNW